MCNTFHFCFHTLYLILLIYDTVPNKQFSFDKINVTDVKIVSMASLLHFCCIISNHINLTFFSHLDFPIITYEKKLDQFGSNYKNHNFVETELLHSTSYLIVHVKYIDTTINK